MLSNPTIDTKKLKELDTTIVKVLKGVKNHTKPAQTLTQSIDEVASKERWCDYTGDDGAITYSVIKERERYSRVNFDATKKGVELLLETLLQKAKEEGPLSYDQIINHIEDTKKYSHDHCWQYGGRGKYQVYNENITAAKDKITKETDFFCPFCKHNMEKHSTVGKFWDVNRGVQCTDCECNDNIHPRLIDLKDKSLAAARTTGICNESASV